MPQNTSHEFSDTICVSENAKALSRLLQAIEKEGARYGLHLKCDECELIRICYGGQLNNTDQVYFSNGTPVVCKAEAKDLACWLSETGDPDRETKNVHDNSEKA